MLYCTPPTADERIRRAIADALLVFIDTPAQGNRRPPGVTWCADNSVFGEGWRGYDWWFRWLTRNSPDAGRCLFATAPDALCDHQRSYRRADPWLDRVRNLGYPVAWVAQNGATLRPGSIPWDRFDCLFVGGDDEWKLGPTALRLAYEAKARSKWVHVGRVNSRRRFLQFDLTGLVDSVDGTYVTFGPRKNAPTLLQWVSTLPVATF